MKEALTGQNVKIYYPGNTQDLIKSLVTDVQYKRIDRRRKEAKTLRVLRPNINTVFFFRNSLTFCILLTNLIERWKYIQSTTYTIDTRRHSALMSDHERLIRRELKIEFLLLWQVAWNASICMELVLQNKSIRYFQRCQTSKRWVYFIKREQRAQSPLLLNALCNGLALNSNPNEISCCLFEFHIACYSSYLIDRMLVQAMS